MQLFSLFRILAATLVAAGGLQFATGFVHSPMRVAPLYSVG